MTTIYSDQYLPKKGELSNNLRNFDRERVLLFDEKQVFDEIIDENEFPLFSNSYLLVVGGAPNVIYTKFSNDRVAKWAIRTSIVREMPGHVHVEKLPDTEAACRHLLSTKQACEQLSARYENTKIDINQCTVPSSAATSKTGCPLSTAGGRHWKICSTSVWCGRMWRASSH